MQLFTKVEAPKNLFKTVLDKEKVSIKENPSKSLSIESDKRPNDIGSLAKPNGDKDPNS